MARIGTTYDFTEVDGDHGGWVDGVQVTCDRCGHKVASGGTHDGSFARCAALLREECPLGESNYYEV